MEPVQFDMIVRSDNVTVTFTELFKACHSKTGHVYDCINGSMVDSVANYRNIGVHFSNDLSWTYNYSTLISKAYNTLHFLSRTMSPHHSSANLHLLSLWFKHMDIMFVINILKSTLTLHPCKATIVAKQREKAFPP